MTAQTTSREHVFRLGILLLGACLLLPTASACSKEQRDSYASRAKTHKRQMETTQLRDRVMEYWEAVRWENWNEASTFFLDSQDQVEFLRSHSNNKNGRLDEIEIKYAFIEPDQGQAAEIRIGWNTVIANQAKVEKQLTTQHWIKKFGRWWITSAEGAAKATEEAKAKDEDDS